MVGKARHLVLGRAGEDAAVRYVQGLGWRVLERNWRPAGAEHGLELDIVALGGGCLVFVEVKTRTPVRTAAAQARKTAPDGIPVSAAFTAKKQARLVRAARHYLAKKALWNMPCRFDLICVQQGPEGPLELEHHDNVIELGHFVDSGHTAWQPW